MNERKIIETALAGFGIEKQRAKCIEELSELIKELCKDAIGKGDRFHIADEIADVLITVEQMTVYYDIAALVKNHKDFKLKRLASLLNMDNDDKED